MIEYCFPIWYYNMAYQIHYYGGNSTKSREAVSLDNRREETHMFYTRLYDLLPEIAVAETRTITLIEPFNTLPVGDYGLVEMYCNEIGCDCRRVFLYVITPDSKDPLAVIAYGWESLGFYARWYYMSDNLDDLSVDDLEDLARIKGPCLNDLSPRSKYAPDVLKLVTEFVLSDTKYVDRLKRHYKLFKKELERKNKENAR